LSLVETIAWGLVIAIDRRDGRGLAYLTGYGHGPGSAAFEKIAALVNYTDRLRAGVGRRIILSRYAIERLRMIGLDPSGPSHIRWFIFSLAIGPEALPNILIAFAAP